MRLADILDEVARQVVKATAEVLSDEFGLGDDLAALRKDWAEQFEAALESPDTLEQFVLSLEAQGLSKQEVQTFLAAHIGGAK